MGTESGERGVYRGVMVQGIPNASMLSMLDLVYFYGILLQLPASYNFSIGHL